MTLDNCFPLAARAALLEPSSIRELGKLARNPGMISFAGGTPDPALFPTASIAAATAAILGESASSREALTYGPSEGYLPLRTSLARLMNADGMRANAENILITSGAQQALEFIATLLIDPGVRVIVTHPTYVGALQAFRLYNAELASIPQDESGLDLRSLELELAAGARFIYLVPDFANPTGLSLPLENRQAIVELCARFGVPIVEDQAYRHLTYESSPPPTLLELARRHGRAGGVIYLSTLSKVIAPGLRTGWILAPEELHRKLVMLKQASDLHGTTLAQMIAAQLAESVMATQLDGVRAAYRERRDAMLAALEKLGIPGLRWSKPTGGMFVWLTFPATMDAAQLLTYAVEEQVLFVPGAAFHADAAGQNTARLCFAAGSIASIEEGMVRLGVAFEKLHRAPDAHSASLR
jgi:DNA-binding transcriptional MocR family regulator